VKVGDDLEILATLVLVVGWMCLWVVMATLLALLGGWAVMLALGDLHTAVPQVPTIGYLGAFAVMWGLGFVGAAISRGSSSALSLRGRGSDGA
jgi:hypothetical protein